jgi:hypothetical protein
MDHPEQGMREAGNGWIPELPLRQRAEQGLTGEGEFNGVFRNKKTGLWDDASAAA